MDHAKQPELADGIRQMRVMVVGGGSIGARHMRNLTGLGLERLALVEPESKRRQALCREAGAVGFADLSESCNWHPDLAIIASPTHLHAEQALTMARRNSHLFIEKPLSHSFEHLEELQEEIERRNLISLVACNMRFHPGLMEVKRLLGEGEIGNITAARIQVGQYLPDWHPWEDYRQGYSASQRLGGGVILDAIHELDYTRWLLGEVEAVACFSGKRSDLDIDTEDTAGILLRFSGGAIGEVHLDYVQRDARRTCHVIGDQGSIYWDIAETAVRYYLAQEGDWRSYEIPGSWELNDMYVYEMDHLLKCLAGEEHSVQDVFEARRVLEIALAARESARNSTIVRLQDP